MLKLHDCLSMKNRFVFYRIGVDRRADKGRYRQNIHYPDHFSRPLTVLGKLRKRHQAIVKTARLGFRAHSVTKLGGSCARIFINLTRRRYDWLFALEAESRLQRFNFVRKKPRICQAPPGTPGKKLFDDSILERMKGHNRKPPPLLEDGLSRHERVDQLAKFIIDGDTQSLEDPRRRMHAAKFAGRNPGN